MRNQYKILAKKYQLIVESDTPKPIDLNGIDEYIAEWSESFESAKINQAYFRIFLIEKIQQSGDTVAGFLQGRYETAYESECQSEQEDSGHDISETDWEPDDDDVQYEVWNELANEYNQDFLPVFIAKRNAILNKDNPGIEMDI